MTYLCLVREKTAQNSKTKPHQRHHRRNRNHNHNHNRCYSRWTSFVPIVHILCLTYWTREHSLLRSCPVLSYLITQHHNQDYVPFVSPVFSLLINRLSKERRSMLRCGVTTNETPASGVSSTATSDVPPRGNDKEDITRIGPLEGEDRCRNGTTGVSRSLRRSGRRTIFERRCYAGICSEKVALSG